MLMAPCRVAHPSRPTLSVSEFDFAPCASAPPKWRSPRGRNLGKILRVIPVRCSVSYRFSLRCDADSPPCFTLRGLHCAPLIQFSIALRNSGCNDYPAGANSQEYARFSVAFETRHLVKIQPERLRRTGIPATAFREAATASSMRPPPSRATPDTDSPRPTRLQRHACSKHSAGYGPILLVDTHDAQVSAGLY